MDVLKIREFLRDPLVLNFVSMIFALERTYELFVGGYPAWGHGGVAICFLLGAILGLPFKSASDLSVIGTDKIAFSSYFFFLLGCILLAICISIDVFLFQNLEMLFFGDKGT